MNNELTPNERRQWARTLYTTNGKTIKEVAATVSTDHATIRSWIQEGSWETVRQSLLISKDTQLDRLYQLVDTLNSRMAGGEANPKDMDLLLKYTAAIKNLDTDNSYYSIIETAELFLSWMLRRDAKITQLFTTHFDCFIRERMSS